MPNFINFIKIEETFCGRTDGRTNTRTDTWDRLYRSTLSKSRPGNTNNNIWTSILL